MHHISEHKKKTLKLTRENSWPTHAGPRQLTSFDASKSEVGWNFPWAPTVPLTKLKEELFSSAISGGRSVEGCKRDREIYCLWSRKRISIDWNRSVQQGENTGWNVGMELLTFFCEECCDDRIVSYRVVLGRGMIYASAPQNMGI